MCSVHGAREGVIVGNSHLESLILGMNGNPLFGTRAQAVPLNLK